MVNEAMFRTRVRRLAVVAVSVVIVVFLARSRGNTNTTVNDGPDKNRPYDVVKEEMHGVRKSPAKPSKKHEELRRLLNTTQQFCRNKAPSQLAQNFQNIRPITWLNDSDVTSRLNSSFEIINKQKVYEVCDQIQIKIIARNGRNEQKKYGGDYFRALLVSNDQRGHTMSSRTDGEIVDHGDGTYTATLTLKWPGEVVIRVHLIHTSEAVSVLQKQSQSQQARYSYKGMFCSDDGLAQEERECNVFMSPQTRHVCKFTDRRTRHSWYCHHPTKAGLNCSHWCRYRSDSRAANALLTTTLSEREKAILQPYTATMLHSKDYELYVKPDSHQRLELLPPCKPGYHGNFTQSGYHDDDNWVSPHCPIVRFSSSFPATVDCLRGKSLFFFGDSSIKQLFNYFFEKLKENMEIVSGTVLLEGHSAPILAVDKTRRINLIYRSHGYPIADDSLYSIKSVDYLANILDDLRAGENSVVVISIWRYFTPHNASLYEERVRTILEAVKRLHQRSPKTLVMFNSPNTGNMDKLENIAYSSDWYVRNLDAILRRVLAGYDRIGFLDSWDMTNAQLFPHRTQPVGTHTQNLADHFMSYICPSS